MSKSPLLARALCGVFVALLGCVHAPASLSIEPTPEREQAEAPAFESLDAVVGFTPGPWPEAVEDRRQNVLFDHGAWFGLALPDPAHAGSFAGPYDLRVPGWVGFGGLRFELEGLRPDPASLSLREGPGVLEQSLDYADADGQARARVELRAFFASADELLVAASVRNLGEQPLALRQAWSGRGEGLALEGGAVTWTRAARSTPLRLSVAADAEVKLDAAAGYRAQGPERALDPGAEQRYVVALRSTSGAAPTPLEADAVEARWARNRQRWDTYLRGAWLGRADTPKSERDLAARAVMTLIANWRAPSERVAGSGLFPSWAYDGFHGYWAWDSWKHAVALARFAPELARAQIRVLLDRQREDGMIPDVIYPGPEQDNWRDTKPPLAAWAVAAVVEATGDADFARECLPALLRYHAWWYAQRDHDGDGLCEYGSTDGTRIAAAWESGMDNAVRFDDAAMLAHPEQPGAWSMDRESVDLNAYLVADKRALAQVLRALGQGEHADALTAEAEVLADRVRTEHWDDARGWFRDRRLDGSWAPGWGPEGWTPLWAGLATPEQAQRLRATMLDPEAFATAVPLGTLAASDPNFDPERGYWRGPVWLDQAYFGVAGLRRAGFHDDAEALTQTLLSAPEGLATGGAIRENYHPLTGAGQHARHFSWSAAAVLMLLWDRWEAHSA
ncbi:MGH1-like glycoside hydrolase domain-containing protein [Plesiocystis pacifica]|uniref:MGH1-like glycoside hydrolase domain-containing protein n=1 Tax=Plesiocystis pacifica TaxID=191768 RepID=UPI0012FB8EB2|nr:trehalase family glycosidase [Plesiocystis pacifica]